MCGVSVWRRQRSTKISGLGPYSIILVFFPRINIAALPFSLHFYYDDLSMINCMIQQMDGYFKGLSFKNFNICNRTKQLIESLLLPWVNGGSLESVGLRRRSICIWIN